MTQAIEHTPPIGMSLEDNWADVVQAIADFAVAMRDKMESVKHKGHWRYVDWPYLLDRLDQELEELHGELETGNLGGAIQECIDVGNVACMLADWLKNRGFYV